MKTTLSLICSFCLLVLNTFGQVENDPLLSRHYRHHKEMPDRLTAPNEAQDPHNLKIGSSYIPINTSNNQAPNERQLEIVKNIIKDDFLVNDDTAGGFNQNYPTVVIDLQGNFVIAWEDYRNANPDIYFKRYDSGGIGFGINARVNDDVGSADQRFPSIAISSEGNFVITWQDSRNGNFDIFYQQYDGNGTLVGVNTKVNDDAGTANQWYPSIAMGSQGNFVIAWQDSRNEELDIYYQRYSISGTLMGMNKRANDETMTAYQWNPSITMDSQGNFVIVWQDGRSGELDIYYQRYDSIGTATGVNKKANDETITANQWYPSIAMNNGGNFVIAWEDFRENDFDIYFQRFNSNGTKQGSNTKINDDTGNAYQNNPSISIDSEGNFFIAWEDNRNGHLDIYSQRYNLNGIAQGTNIKVNDDLGTENHTSPSVSMNSQGVFVTVWWDGRNGIDNENIYFQRYNPDGIVQGINTKAIDDVGSANQGSPAISMDSEGNFIIVWADHRNGNSDIYFQRFNSNGTALGINCKVNDDTVNANQNNPIISMDAQGNFVIVWEDERNPFQYVYYQRYNSYGEPQGTNTIVNNRGFAHQYAPSSAMHSKGNFVIAWEEAMSGGYYPNYDIYYKRYDSNGIAQGTIERVNDDSGGAYIYQGSPSISMDSEGNFVIVWEDSRNPGLDIYFQHYDSTGTSRGANSKVNDYYGNANPEYPSVYMKSQGDFVAVWMDRRNGTYNADIYFQRHDLNSIAQGINVKVNSDTGSVYQGFPSISINSKGDFIIVWQDYRYDPYYPDIIGQRYFSDGTPNGSNYLIVADGPNHGETLPVVCSNDLYIVFAWQDDRNAMSGDIYAKIVCWDWGGVTAISGVGNSFPQEFSLSQNYPNPFNPVTKIRYTVPQDVKGETSNVILKVYDVLGNEVATLVNEFKPAGSYETDFNAANLPSGVYFYQLKAGDPANGTSFTHTKKMVLLR